MLAIPAKHLALTSSAGIFAVVVFLVSLLVAGSSMPEYPEPSSYKAIDAAGLPLTVSITIFSMVTHSSTPTLYKPLRRKESFPAIAAAAFCVVAMISAATGMVGYWAYGDTAKPNLLDNIGLDLQGRGVPGLDWLRKLGAALFVVKLQVNQPFIVIPLASLVETRILSAIAHAQKQRGTVAVDAESEVQGAAVNAHVVAAVAPDPAMGISTGEPSMASISTSANTAEMSSDGFNSRRTGSTDEDQSPEEVADVTAKEEAGESSCVITLHRTSQVACIVVSMSIAVAFRDHISTVTDLAGSTFSLAISILLPVVCYWKLHQCSLSWCSQAALAAIGFLGLFIMVMCSYLAVRRLI
jgi:hypothetical protein